MIQNTDPTLQQNYFSPTQIADTDASLANFRIDVPTIQTVNGFCVGDNIADKKLLDDAAAQVFDSTTTTGTNITVDPASYILIIDINNDPNETSNSLYLGVNNSNQQKALDLSVTDPNLQRHVYLFADYYGDGDATTPIPTVISIYNNSGQVVWSFGDTIEVADPSNPTERLVYSASNSSIRKSFVDFDFGTMNTRSIKK